jgi:heme/copper-type cytochrome/quinol oxidase subunit 2
MKRYSQFSRLIAMVAAMGACVPSPVLACAACYGRSDSPLASAMNWGIFTLLGIVVTVLVSIAGFFFYIINRETAQAETGPAAQNLAEVKI